MAHIYPDRLRTQVRNLTVLRLFLAGMSPLPRRGEVESSINRTQAPLEPAAATHQPHHQQQDNRTDCGIDDL